MRHGQSAANASAAVSGQSGTELTTAGSAGVAAAADAVAGPFDAAFAPPLLRSIQTIDVLEASDVIVGERFEDARISERKLGALEEGPWIYVPAYAQGDMLWAPRGGETYQALTRRCLAFLLDLQALSRARDSELDILVCTSRGPLRVLHGILDVADDPRQVLASSFENAATRVFEMTAIQFPRFAQL